MNNNNDSNDNEHGDTRETVREVVIVYGGELAQDVADRIIASRPTVANPTATVTKRSASERPQRLVDDLGSDAVVCFVLQTIENASPTEDGGTTVRYFKRKTHPATLLQGNKFRYAVLGLGDSNLLLDRQTTSARDCNQVAQQFDARLAALGATRQCPLGMADERTGLSEVEPWIQTFWKSFE